MAGTEDDCLSRVDALIAAVQDLAGARTVPEVHRVASRAARRLLRTDGSALVVVDGASAHHLEEDGTGPGWKGRRIPLDSCLSGWCVRQRRAVVIEDVRGDIRLPVAPYWSTPVTGLVMVPVRSRHPIGALAGYWTGRHRATGEEVRLLQALADSAALALDHTTLEASLDEQVRRRTAELEEANSRLRREIGERRRAEDEVRQLSLVDELTGLYNRRGFTLLAGRELESARRAGRRGMVLYIDLDGLKQANDRRGHDAGDRLLQRAASVLRSVVRTTDVAARIGGDEFAVFMTLGYDHPAVHLIVERFLDAARGMGVRWSVGATATPGDRVMTLEDLLLASDEAMYRGRRARRRADQLVVGS